MEPKVPLRAGGAISPKYCTKGHREINEGKHIGRQAGDEAAHSRGDSSSSSSDGCKTTLDHSIGKQQPGERGAQYSPVGSPH